MNGKIFIGLILMLLVGAGPIASFSQQIPQFSQYIFNGLHINPAYAGYKNQAYLQATYRNQWANMTDSPRTLSVTGDFSLNDGLMGLGVSLLNDQIGPTRTTTGILSYSYKIQTGETGFLSFGIGAGANQHMIDTEMLNPLDIDDPDLNFDSQVMFTPNLNSGLFFYTENFYAGFSVFNLVGRQSSSREDMALAYHEFNYFLTAGAFLHFNDMVAFKPSFLIREMKGAPTSYDLNGMLLLKERIWLGASYRSNFKTGNEIFPGPLNNRTAVAFIIEIFATENLRVGYAYDNYLNALQNMGGNAHEFSMGYYITKKITRLKNPRWF